MKQLSILIISVAAFASSGLSSAYSANQPTLADYSVGEKWVWKYKGMTSEGEVRAEGVDTKQIVLAEGKKAMQMAHGTIPLTNIVRPVLSETPRYKWPLEVGKTWKFESSWTSEDGTQGSTSQDAEVLSYQQEQVEAGTFMAFKIRFAGNISGPSGHSSYTEDMIWYAPTLKTFIKLRQTQDGYVYNEELIEYDVSE